MTTFFPNFSTLALRARLLRLASQRMLVAGLCLAAAGIVYAPALAGDFIWDDLYLVRENPFFKSPVFGLEVFRHYLFFDSFSTYYRPVQNWSYLFDYWLWRGNPAGYHTTNILLHATCGWLLYLLLRRILTPLWEGAPARREPGAAVAALLAALIWLVHPVHNAAVAYISGRADSLAALFALLAWLLALRAQETPRRGPRLLCAALAMGSMLLALCAKEIALVWLGLFVGHQWFFTKRETQRAAGGGRWMALGLALAVLAAYAFLHALPAARVPMEDGPAPPFAARVLLMLRALGDYARLIVFPGQLYMERSISDPDAYHAAVTWRAHLGYEWLTVLGLLTGWAVFVLCAHPGPGRRVRWLGAGWFLFAFLPISNLFPLNAEVAEHWIYLASMGAFIFLLGCGLALPARAQSWAVLAAALALVPLGIRTTLRSGDWVDSVTFCQRTIAAGGATPRLLNTLAAIYGERHDWPRQEQLLRKIVEQFPGFTPARLNLGSCLLHQGKTAEAEPWLQLSPEAAATAARHYPRTWPAVLNLAQTRWQTGQPEEALSLLREARGRFPETWELVKGESQILQETRGAADALPAVAGYAAAHWWHLDAWFTLGQLRAAAGDADGALVAFQQASRLDLYAAQPLASIARLELDRHRPAAALTAQLAAMLRDPDQPTRYVALAEILEALDQKAEATAALHKAQVLSAAARKS